MMIKNIKNESVLDLYTDLSHIFLKNNEPPVRYAALVHEIGHLDNCVSVGAKLGVLKVGKYVFKYEDGKWFQSYRNSFLKRDCVIAFIDTSIQEEDSLKLIKMFNGGLEFTDLIKEILPNNWWDKWNVQRHYKLNTPNRKRSKHGDVRVIEDLLNNPLSINKHNNRLRTLYESEYQ